MKEIIVVPNIALLAALVTPSFTFNKQYLSPASVDLVGKN
jgi:hypothetical protein